MKKVLVIFTISIFALGCNMNPNKEARIQKLETEILSWSSKINQLETRIDTLENKNERLSARILKTKKR